MFGLKNGGKRKFGGALLAAAVAITGLSLALAAGESTEPADASAEGAGDTALFDQYMADGAQVFATICAACHGAEGNESLSSHVEILAGNERAVGTPRVTQRVLFGGTYMPAFGAALDDHQVAAVITFIRNSWGNDFEMMTEEEVARVRAQFE